MRSLTLWRNPEGDKEGGKAFSSFECRDDNSSGTNGAREQLKLLVARSESDV